MKDAETLTTSKMVDDVILTARQLETLLYGDYKKRIKLEIFTDSESMLESITSSRQIERKTLRLTVKDLKDLLQDKEIDSYQWLPTHEIWADVLTKEMMIPAGLESFLLDNVFDLPGERINKVQAVDGEIRMENIRNKKVVFPDDG